MHKHRLTRASKSGMPNETSNSTHSPVVFPVPSAQGTLSPGGCEYLTRVMNPHDSCNRSALKTRRTGDIEQSSKCSAVQGSCMWEEAASSWPSTRCRSSISGLAPPLPAPSLPFRGGLTFPSGSIVSSSTKSFPFWIVRRATRRRRKTAIPRVSISIAFAGGRGRRLRAGHAGHCQHATQSPPTGTPYRHRRRLHRRRVTQPTHLHSTWDPHCHSRHVPESTSGWSSAVMSAG